jgi:hypothetical protein
VLTTSRIFAAVAALTAAVLPASAAGAACREDETTTHGTINTFPFPFPCVADSANPYTATTTSATETVGHRWLSPGELEVTFSDAGTYTATSATGGPAKAGNYTDDYTAHAWAPITFTADGQVQTAGRFTYVGTHRRPAKYRHLRLTNLGRLFFNDRITIDVTNYNADTSQTTDDVTCGPGA